MNAASYRDLEEALSARLAASGFEHLRLAEPGEAGGTPEIRSGDRSVSPGVVWAVRPRDPDWRRFEVEGLPEDENLMRRLASLDETLTPYVCVTDEALCICMPREEHLEVVAREGLEETEALVRELVEHYLSPQFSRPVLALVLEETDDGWEYRTEYREG